ncbi:MAG: DTW domain-containing protein, partial [Bdellovibrionales bacterium]|nr:DTW domain-containing protein [Bdellovibrionales bacterium]
MQARPFCWTCRQPQTACYCARLRRFDSGIEFVILIHPIESRRRIATGRMSHLILENSHLIEGEEFSQDRRVQALLDRTDVYPTVLYPGKTAQDLGTLSAAERRALV